jgi:uncharacterized protein YwqG
MSNEDGELDGLIAQLIAKINEIAITEHVGHLNRLFTQKKRIYDAIETLPEGSEALTKLLENPDPIVQLDVAWNYTHRQINLEAVSSVLSRLATRSDKIGAGAKSALQCRPFVSTGASPAFTPRTFPFLPAPRGCNRGEAERIIDAALIPERARQIKTLLRPAIRLWPKKSAGSPTASRFGGLPAVPADWSWPFADEEPLLFLAQINCAELGPLAKTFNLPDHGLLSFFGDSDDVNGCEPKGGGNVFYFETTSELRSAALPLDDFEPLITCGVSFYQVHEVPHPYSAMLEALELSDAELQAYGDLYEDVSKFGFYDQPDADDDEISKLLGWPDLIQGEVNDDKTQLLLQIGWYRDGKELECWGPGGTLYFVIKPNDLAQRRFERSELVVQCT